MLTYKVRNTSTPSPSNYRTCLPPISALAGGIPLLAEPFTNRRLHTCCPVFDTVRLELAAANSSHSLISVSLSIFKSRLKPISSACLFLNTDSTSHQRLSSHDRMALYKLLLIFFCFFALGCKGPRAKNGSLKTRTKAGKDRGPAGRRKIKGFLYDVSELS